MKAAFWSLALLIGLMLDTTIVIFLMKFLGVTHVYN